ncbi:MAG: hypothetical protein JWM95_331 [Gemmatimonadetes bacterium]|nr:hypothetical protein [Gemmatimonadota bacterium]
MTDNPEFAVLSDEDSAAIEGGFGIPWMIVIGAISSAISECIKYSADFVQGVRQGAEDAR